MYNMTKYIYSPYDLDRLPSTLNKFAKIMYTVILMSFSYNLQLIIWPSSKSTDLKFWLFVCSLKKKKDNVHRIKNKMTSQLSSHYAVQIFPSIITLQSQSHWRIFILFASRYITPKYDSIGSCMSCERTWCSIFVHAEVGMRFEDLYSAWVEWTDFYYFRSLSGSVQHVRISILW